MPAPILDIFASHFRFAPDTFPLGNWPSVFIAIAIYLVTIFGLKRWMEDKKRYELTMVVALHNFFLSALSLTMLLGMLFEVLKIIVTNNASPETMLCDPHRKLAVGPQVGWFYIFFLSKFYELVDTVIICLKKRPIIFLHVYHHCITLALVYVMMSNEVAVQWISMTANCLVHIPMYYYYGLSALGYDVWWKKYITKLQIAQFIVTISANTIGFVYHFKGYDCSGSVQSWLFGQAILLSFLVLFILFYKSTYRKPAASGGDAAPQKKAQ